jgi:hypothetical protein
MRPPVRKALARKQLLAPCRQRPRPQRAKCRQRVVDRSLNLLGGVGTLGPNGDPLPPAKVADALVEFFRDVRTVETPIGGGEAIEEPVGASVVVNVELSGLRGQAVDLLWEIYEAGGDRGSLFGRWLSSTPAYRLEPSTDHDTTSAALWIPLPPDESRYYVQLTLLTNGTPLYTSVSDQFR